MPISVADLWERVERDVPGLGVVNLQSPTLGDMGNAERLVATMPTEQRAAAFSNSLIAAVIHAPSSTPEQIGDLAEEAVAVLAETTAGLAGLTKEYAATPVSTSARERLYQAHQNYFRSLLRGRFPRFLEGMGNPFENLYGLAGEAVREASIPYLVGEGLGRSLQQMGQVDRTLWAGTLNQAGFELDAQIMEEIGGQLAGESLQELVADLIRIELPEPFLSDALVASGLNSSLIHSPLYQLPTVEPIQTLQALSLRTTQAERSRLLDAYDMLMTLELRLREVVEVKLRELHGDPWWRRGVPDTIRQECARRKRERETPLGPRHHPLAYCYVDELKSLIIRRDNWEQSFEALFGNRGQVEAIFL